MENAGCLGENKQIINEKLYHAFITDAVDIKALGCALGRQQLDESLMNVELLPPKPRYSPRHSPALRKKLSPREEIIESSEPVEEFKLEVNEVSIIA